MFQSKVRTAVSDYQQYLSLEIQKKDLVETKDVVTSLSTGDVQGMYISNFFAVHYGSIDHPNGCIVDL